MCAIIKQGKFEMCLGKIVWPQKQNNLFISKLLSRRVSSIS